METNNNKKTTIAGDKQITRKEALKKTGKYAALTAATMFMVLSPKEAPALSNTSSPQNPSDW